MLLSSLTDWEEVSVWAPWWHRDKVTYHHKHPSVCVCVCVCVGLGMRGVRLRSDVFEILAGLFQNSLDLLPTSAFDRRFSGRSLLFY